jgi:putative ATP-dependent endonuclease of OLD family
VIVRGSTVEDIVERLDGFLDPGSIQRQLDGVCLGALGEGFFADVVLLVEGSTDRAVLTGAAATDSVPLLLDGIFVGEAGGKTRLLLPYVIFDAIGIPVYLVADNDSHLRDELEDVKANGDEVRAREAIWFRHGRR